MGPPYDKLKMILKNIMNEHLKDCYYFYYCDDVIILIVTSKKSQGDQFRKNMYKKISRACAYA